MLDAPATASVLTASACALVFLAAYHLWYAWGVSRLLAAHGAPSWRAWVPVLGESEVFRLGRVDPVRVALLLVPFVAVYGFVLRVMAVHRINAGYGRGAGMTVLGAVLPPVWAMLLADAQPNARADAADSDAVSPVLPPASDADVSPLSAAPPAPITAAPAAPAAPEPMMHVPAPPAPPALPAPAAPAPASSALMPVPVAAAPAPAPIMHVPGAPAPPHAPATADLDDRTQLVTAPDGVDESTHVSAGGKWELVLSDGSVVALTQQVVVLGRRPASTDASTQAVAVPDHTRTVSKQHARLAWSGDGWTITDLGSTNGVYLLTAVGEEHEIEAGVASPVDGAFVLGEYRLEVRPAV